MRSKPVMLGTFIADASGVVTANVVLPDSAEAGSHTLTLSGPVTGDHIVRFRLVAAEKQSVAAPPSTGTDLTLPLALGGAALVLLTACGVVLYRRRAARASADSPPAGQPTATPIAEPIA